MRLTIALFDTDQDPHELNNLADARPEVVNRGLVLLEAWHEEMMSASESQIDPIRTVLAEGGPFHSRGMLNAYVQRLRSSGRAQHAETLLARHRTGEWRTPTEPWQGGCMNHRERVMAAIDHQTVDRLPVDIWCVPEITDRLLAYCGASEWRQVLDALDIDGIPTIRPPYIGPALPDLGADRQQDEWGFQSRRQVYNTGVYWEQVGYPLSQARTIADLDAWDWPDPDWYDYAALPDLCREYKGRAVQVGYTAVFYWHNRLRGLGLSMMDLALDPDFSKHLIRRVSDFFAEYHQRCFEAAGDSMQITQVTDDYGSQKGLLISQEMFREFYRAPMQRAIDLAKGYGYRILHHDDGAIIELVPDLIEMGIDILNPVQWRCQGMDRQELGRRFGQDVCFHAGVDNQETLPFGTEEDVRQEVAYNIKTLAPAGTGYIIGPCHNIQANTPLENILALYEAPRTREG